MSVAQAKDEAALGMEPSTQQSMDLTWCNHVTIVTATFRALEPWLHPFVATKSILKCLVGKQHPQAAELLKAPPYLS